MLIFHSPRKYAHYFVVGHSRGRQRQPVNSRLTSVPISYHSHPPPPPLTISFTPKWHHFPLRFFFSPCFGTQCSNVQNPLKWLRQCSPPPPPSMANVPRCRMAIPLLPLNSLFLLSSAPSVHFSRFPLWLASPSSASMLFALVGASSAACCCFPLSLPYDVEIDVAASALAKWPLGGMQKANRLTGGQKEKKGERP